MRWSRCFKWSGVAVLVVLAVGLWVGVVWGRAALERWTRSEGFQRMISREVSRAMKVDGQFAPIVVEGWEARTAGYRSTGWPGEAIGGLEAEEIHAVFNPWAVLRRVWQVDRIEIARGRFVLRMPDDALKRPVERGKRPWYAVLMPDRFFCPEIRCPEAEVVFPFQGREARLRGLNLTARMVGRDFGYRADAGFLDFPLLPEMAVRELDLFVTREAVDVRGAKLEAPGGGEVEIRGRMGMREDKSLAARLRLERVAFDRVLPGEWRERVRGTLDGEIDWQRDREGVGTRSEGQVMLRGVVIQGWPWLEHVARLQKNPELARLEVPVAGMAYGFDGKKFQAREILVDLQGGLKFRGEVGYDWETRQTEATLVLDSFSVERWLPAFIRPRVQAKGYGWVYWSGSPVEAMEATTRAELWVPGGVYRPPAQLVRLLGRHGYRLPEEFELELCGVKFWSRGGRFQATDLRWQAKGSLHVWGQCDWWPGDRFAVDMRFTGLDAGAWKPVAGAGKVAGMLSGAVRWQARQQAAEHGEGEGTLKLAGGRLAGFGFQDTLARFTGVGGLRDLRFEQFEADWRRTKAGTELKNIRVLARGKMGLEGGLKMDDRGVLDGVLWVGLDPEAVAWLPDPKGRLFRRREHGLVWMQVRVGGTTKRIEHDLGRQVRAQVLRHPSALFHAAGKGLSMWLGDVLGTYQPPVVN